MMWLSIIVTSGTLGFFLSFVQLPKSAGTEIDDAAAFYGITFKTKGLNVGDSGITSSRTGDYMVNGKGFLLPTTNAAVTEAFAKFNPLFGGEYCLHTPCSLRVANAVCFNPFRVLPVPFAGAGRHYLADGGVFLIRIAVLLAKRINVLTSVLAEPTGATRLTERLFSAFAVFTRVKAIQRFFLTTPATSFEIHNILFTPIVYSDWLAKTGKINFSKPLWKPRKKAGKRRWLPVISRSCAS